MQHSPASATSSHCSLSQNFGIRAGSRQPAPAINKLMQIAEAAMRHQLTLATEQQAARQNGGTNHVAGSRDVKMSEAEDRLYG